MKKKYILFTARDIDFRPCFSILVENHQVPPSWGIIGMHERLTKISQSIDKNVHVLSLDFCDGNTLSKQIAKLCILPDHKFYLVSQLRAHFSRLRRLYRL